MPDFEKVTEKWVSEEKKREQDFPDPPDATDIASERLGELVRAKYEGNRLLPKVKKDLLKSIDVQDVLALIFTFLSEYLDSLSSRVDDGEDLLEDLKSEIESSPEPKDDEGKLDAVDGLIDKVRKAAGRRTSPDPTVDSPETEAIQDKLQSVVEGGVLDGEEVQKFLRESGISPQQQEITSQKIRQIDSRYYEVMSESGRNLEVDEADSFRVVDADTGEEVQSVAGYDRASISPDGVITLENTGPGTEETRGKKLNIVPESTRGKRRGQNVSSTIDFDSAVGAVDSSFEREKWNCVILSIVDELVSVLGDLRAGVRRLKRVIEVNARDVIDENYLDFVPSVEDVVRSTLFSIKSSLSELSDLPRPSGFSLQASQTASPSISPPDAPSVCKENKSNYCQISSLVGELSSDLRAELETLNLSFGEKSLSEVDDALDFTPSEKVPELEGKLESILGEMDKLEDEVEKLQKDVCHWVHENVGGRPASLSDVEETWAQVGVLLGEMAAVVPDMEVPEELEEMVDQLDRAGLDRMRDLLEEGSVRDFLASDAEESTYAGQSARILGQKANEARTRTNALKLRELEGAAQSRANRVQVGQEIRDGVQNRYHTYTGADSARNIRQAGLGVIEEVEDE